MARSLRWLWLPCTMAVCVILTWSADAQRQEHTDGRLLEWLRELKPLPKVHYSFSMPLGHISDELHYEYVRLTHAVCVSGEWWKPEEVDRMVRICKRVQADKPAVAPSIGLNFSVWHRRFGKALPPTDTGPSHRAELEYLKLRLQQFLSVLAEANRRHGTQVRVTAVLFDSERFRVRAGDADWNRAITQKYDAAYAVVRQLLPEARVEWYARGAIQRSATSSGWSQAPYFTLKERGRSFACSLYRVPEIGYTREAYRRTVQNALRHGCDQVTPWVALAAGYRRKTHKFHEFSFDWNYDLIYSWQLGAELNHPWFGAPEREARFAPWRYAEVVVFYPPAFDPRVPHWGKHFVAYVRGAHLIRSLPEP